MTRNQNRENNKIYDGYGHRHAEQIQKTQERIHIYTIWAPKNDTKSHLEQNIQWLTITRNHNQKNNRFLMAMATDTQTKFRRGRIPNIFTNLWTPKNDTKSKPEKQKIYDGYGHRHTKQIQKTVEIQTFEDLWTPKNDKTSEPGKLQILRWLWAPRHTKQIQETQEPKHIHKPMDT